MDNTEWLAGLKVGDEVAIPNGFYAPLIRKVSHVTATQVVVGGVRFNRKDGWERGSSRRRSRISEVTAEIIEERSRYRNIRLISSIAGSPRKLELLSTEDLQAIADILRKYEEKEASK